MKRIFIGVEVVPGKEFTRILSLLRKICGNDRVKWVEQSNIHITLAFLGDTEADRIGDINAMLDIRCGGSGSFDLVLKGLGVFKNLNDPRIIWAGIESPEKLTLLHGAIKSGLNDCGIKIEERSFKPHLTLGRIKELKNTDLIKKFIEDFRENVIQKVTVNEVIIYESILLPSGPVYKHIGKVSLQQ
jgi:2'-5' RNA ligase